MEQGPASGLGGSGFSGWCHVSPELHPPGSGCSLPWPWASWLPSTGSRRGWVECRALRLPVSPCSALCSQCATCHKCPKLGAKCSARGPGAGPSSCLPASARGTAAWRSWGASCFSPACKELGGQRDRRVQRNSSYNTETLRHRHAQTHTHTHTLPAAEPGRHGRFTPESVACASHPGSPGAPSLPQGPCVAPASALGGPGLQRQLSVCWLTVELGPGYWAPPCPTNPGLIQSKHPVQTAHGTGPWGGPQACSGASGDVQTSGSQQGQTSATCRVPCGLDGAGWAVATAGTGQEAQSLERRPPSPRSSFRDPGWPRAEQSWGQTSGRSTHSVPGSSLRT